MSGDPVFRERMCVKCGKNPIPYLPGLGIQSTMIDNCDECSKLADKPPEIVKRGIKKGQKLVRNKYYRVVVMGGLDELTGEQKILYTGEHTRYDREAYPEAKKLLKELGGRYSTVYMVDRNTDKMFVIARFEWETTTKITQKMVQRPLREEWGS